MQTVEEDKPAHGRPVEKPIPDTLENIAKAVLAAPPKDEEEWAYLKKQDKL